MRALDPADPLLYRERERSGFAALTTRDHTLFRPSAKRTSELVALQAVIDTIDQEVLIVDQLSQLVMCNQLFLRMWRIPDRYASDYTAMLNYIVLQLVHPDVFISTTTSINGQIGTATVSEVALKDGRTIEQRSRSITFEGQSWRVWYFRDMTSHKVVEAKERQQVKLAALGQQIVGVAHELNNPLAAVLGLAQLMLRHSSPQQMVEDLRAIEASAQRAKHIVSQMLTFGRAQQDVRQPVDMALLIDRVVANLHRSLQIDDIQVDVHVQPGLPAILGHVYQIEQVLDNLLHNAIHALREQQQPLRYIRVEASGAAAQVLLKVTDNGPGIPFHILPRIFDAFFTTKEVGRGTGLGLSLVHEIITSHGGTICAESPAGQGSTFVVELPVANQPGDHQTSIVDRRPGSLPQSILVIEDEVFVRMVIKRALGEQGCKVDTATSAQEGLQKITTGNYDLVISDLRLPDMSGHDLFVQVQTGGSSLLWVFVTGDTLSPEAHTLSREFNIPILAKPFTLDELWNTIAISVVDRYRS